MKNFKECVIYQIWPRSFCDSNGDGIGDLNGICSKLDYLKSLSVDYIWLSPIYATHNKDYGYDIDDYYTINREFGTMEDFDHLLAECKKRGMNIIMDLVANHTSDHHIWFKQAIKDKNSPYRDFYYFRDGRKKDIRNRPADRLLPPNNWLSAFGGSAWQYDVSSRQFYLTMFTPNQCDLNWKNKKVREGIYDIMRFWLDKGIAGFRMDVINTISKQDGLPHLGKTEKLDFPYHEITSLPKSHLYLQEMYDKVLSHYDCITIGEGMATGMRAFNEYTRPENHELNMMFHFGIAGLGCGMLGKFDYRRLYHFTISDMKRVITKWNLAVQDGGGWIANYLSNHDQPRQLTRFGNTKRYRVASAKALAMLNFTLRGTPFIYQGEEIGMTECRLDIEDWKDYEAINAYQVLQSMMHLPAFLAKKVIMKMTRDHARTPMQWSARQYAGFSSITPWIKLNPNYKKINVTADLKSKDSIIRFYHELILLRRKYPALIYGNFQPLCESNRRSIIYLREYEGSTILVAINLSAKKSHVDVRSTNFQHGVLLLGTHFIDSFSLEFTLAPYEGRIYLIK